MPDDIVARLRKQVKTGSIFATAADEIERLREKVADLERQLANSPSTETTIPNGGDPF